MTRSSFGLVAFAFAGGLAGCLSSNPPGDVGQTASSEIGVEGGSLAVAGFAMTIPPGALTSTVRVSMTTIPGADELVGHAVQLGPDGLVFSQPVSLAFEYRTADLPAGGSESLLALAVLEGQTWVELADSTVDTTRHVVQATTMHFSPYGIVHRCSERRPCPEGQSCVDHRCVPPSAEVCDNEADDDGDGAIDCQDPDCQADTSHCDCTQEGELLCCHPRCAEGETLECLGENICGYPCHCTSGPAKWYLTCGDPVCRGWTGASGLPLCTAEKPGDACSEVGVRCDPKDECNALLECATSDPRQRPGGCPISRREVKHAIHYLDADDLGRTLEEVLATRLATWRYDFDPARERLGFIIDDRPGSPAVDAERDMVDLYGFTSLAIGAIQAQQGEIDELRARLDALERRCGPER